MSSTRSLVPPIARLGLILTLTASPLAAQRPMPSGPVTLDSALLEGFQWRNLGPDRGGRSIAASGVRGHPELAYFGAVGGGLWKTTDAGVTWKPVTDGQITSASVGAVAVSETNPDLVLIGMGESAIRGNIMPGDGIYRSTDAGETWTHVGFRNVDAISKIRIHPTNPDVAFAAVFGQYSVPSEERGIFKSTDGGQTWRKVLYRDDKTGGVDISIDRNNPDVMYAALWEAYRKEYQMSSGGPGCGLFKSTDGGEHWTEITRNPGLPQDGLVGRIGVAVSRANSNRVYALVENDNGGLFKSDDAGATWELMNDDRRIRQRAFYYTHVFADTKDQDVVYMQNTSLFRSTDAGKTSESLSGTHGDFHDLWIDPDDPAHLVVANDGGGAVSVNTGGDWTDEDFPTPQFYHVVTTAHIPFHVCGAQQDNSTLCIPFDWNRGGRGFFGGGGDDGDRDPTAGGMEEAYPVGGGEPGYIAPDPNDLMLFYSGANNGGYVDKYDRGLDLHREVNPYPWFYSGEPSKEIRERWQWTFPILFSPVDHKTLYVSSQHLWSTSDGGKTWNRLSDDLTRHDPMTLQESGGPITHDMNGPEVYATIFSVGPGKKNMNVIWAGSDDGLVHVTQDGGKTWTNITPQDMPDFGRVSQIDASSFNDGAAYVAVKRPLLNDRAPYIYRTKDYGKTWTKTVSGIRGYVHAVREDPNRQGLLYAATQHGVFVSYDDGDHWQDLTLNMPDLPVVDLVVEKNELVIASHGRGFWVLDNIAPLRQATQRTIAEDLTVFTPPVATRSGPDVELSWWTKTAPQDGKVEVLDSVGAVLRTFIPDTTTPDTTRARRGGDGRFGGATWMPTNAGLNKLSWNLQAEPFETFEGMIFWGARTAGPAVPPGRYTVRVTAAGRTASAPLTVRRNPWITDVTDADLHAQYEFSRAVRDKVTEANEAVVAIRNVKAQLEDRYEKSDDARLHDAGDRLETNASDVEDDIYQVKNRSNQDPLNFPIRVNNRLANLMAMAERGDGRPTTNMPEIFQILSEQLKGYTDRLDEVWETDLAAVNRELSRLNLATIDPQCTKAEGCRPIM
jgi:photosystem II stability/assembly factor-like uncharacterized protein